MARVFVLVILGMVMAPRVALADGSGLFDGAAPLFQTRAVAPAVASPSLFIGPSEGSFFAPFPDRPSPGSGLGPNPQVRGSVGDLLSLIAEAEAGPAGYDAVNGGARIRPPRPPSQMTLGEIHAWIVATPGQPHAIGRYQFIPDTLTRVARVAGVGPEARFSPQVQDRLAQVLLNDAGINRFTAGELDRRRFMHNLARIWAGLPLPNGQSYYEGYAGNTATMTWSRFAAGMEAIWPEG